MRAIVITENSQCDISPLTTRTPYALLPLAGKSILVHALETLHRSSVREVDVVAPNLHDELKAAVGTASLPRMRLRFMTECPDLRDSPGLSLLIGLSDLFDVDWYELVESLGVVKVHHLIPSMLMVGSTNVALLTPPFFSEPVSSDWNEIEQIEAVPVQLPGPPERLGPINSFAAYCRANFHVLRGKFKYLKVSGRKFTSGYHVGSKSKLHEDSLGSSCGYVGSDCRIEKSACLSGDVVIGDKVVIAKGAHVSDSIIFDNTYIGANLDCRNSIVDGNLLIRVDTGACLESEDPVLFGSVASLRELKRTGPPQAFDCPIGPAKLMSRPRHSEKLWH